MDIQQEPEPESGTAAEKTLASLLLEIEADPTLGYASIQNSVPVVRALRVTNCGSEPLEAVEVLVGCNPRFAQGVKLHFAKLAPDESRRVSPLDLAPDHSYLRRKRDVLLASDCESVRVASFSCVFG